MHIISTSDAGQKFPRARSLPPSRGTSDFRIDWISETELETLKESDSSNPVSFKYGYGKTARHQDSDQCGED